MSGEANHEPQMAIRLRVLSQRLAVWRLEPDAPLPDLGIRRDAKETLFSVTRTPSQLSIVCNEKSVPEEAIAERGFRALEVVGPLDFGLTGILAGLSQPLAEAKISIFAISSYDTDHVLVKEALLERAQAVLKEAGHEFV